MRINQRGFTILEIALIIVIVGVVCGIIGYVISNVKDNDNTKSSSISTNTDAQPADKITKETPKPAATISATDSAAIAKVIATEVCNGTGEAAIAKSLSDSKQAIISGKFARVSTGCEDAESGFTSYLLHREDWEILSNAQQIPSCEPFDGLSVPASILDKCVDESGAERAPRQI